MARGPQHASQYKQTKQFKQGCPLASKDQEGFGIVKDHEGRIMCLFAKPVALSQDAVHLPVAGLEFWLILAIAVARSPDEPLPSTREPLAARRPVSILSMIQYIHFIYI